MRETLKRFLITFPGRSQQLLLLNGQSRRSHHHQIRLQGRGELIGSPDEFEGSGRV
jgi:hypothetical protein